MDSDLPALNDGSVSSLLSLSIAAANAAPIPVSAKSPTDSAVQNDGMGHYPSSSAGAAKHHRRLSSSGKARRRLSDARDAATRPSVATLQTATVALSPAALTISSSPPPPGGLPQRSIPLGITASHAIPIPPYAGSRTPMSPATVETSQSAPLNESHSFPPRMVSVGPIAANGSGGKSGKKRGMTFTCESCSKVYRHPSCLIKHRWEHSPHWREASKFVLSKHQQVQLLEAAAILSHMSISPEGTSLPEDRSLWPSFLSGGLLPPPTEQEQEQAARRHPISSSVPARATSQGPRLHDYAVPSTAVAAGITQLRPGLLGVPTTHPTSAMPVPPPNGRHREKDEGWGSTFGAVGPSSSIGGGGGWSLPRSSIRSISISVSSRSNASEEEEEDDDDDEVDWRRGWKIEEEDVRIDFSSVREENEDEGEGEEWDGMEMEMEME